MPAGAVGGRAEIMDRADPARGSEGLYHGGSFNGNVLASIAGRLTVEHLTKQSIDRMDTQADRLKDMLEAKAKDEGVPLYVLKEGSVMGLYFTESKPRPGSDLPNPDLVARFHLACLNNGVQMGPGGMVSMSTAVTNEALEEAIEGMSRALEEIAP